MTSFLEQAILDHINDDVATEEHGAMGREH